MTYGIHKSVNHKNKFHKKHTKLNRNSTEFNNKKQEFNVYKIALRRLINQAKNVCWKKNMANNG